MTKYKAAELAKLIGQERQYVNTYVGRGKIIRDVDGFIDISNPINKGWYDQMRAIHISKISDPAYIAPEYSKPKDKPARVAPQKKASPKKVATSVQTRIPKTDVDGEQQELDFEAEPDQTVYARKLQADLDLKLLDIEKRKIEIAQKEGKLLNMDVAKGIVSAYMSSYSKGLYRDIETWVHRIMDIYKIPLTEKTKHATELERLMNRASERTMKEIALKFENENSQL